MIWFNAKLQKPGAPIFRVNLAENIREGFVVY